MMMNLHIKHDHLNISTDLSGWRRRQLDGEVGYHGVDGNDGREGYSRHLDYLSCSSTDCWRCWILGHTTIAQVLQIYVTVTSTWKKKLINLKMLLYFESHVAAEGQATGT